MKNRKWFALLLTILMLAAITVPASAAGSYTICSGDTLWKVALQFKVSISDILKANKSIWNPNVICPGDNITIPPVVTTPSEPPSTETPPSETPSVDITTLSYEEQVVALVNQIRKQNGLNALTLNTQLSQVARLKSADMQKNNYFSHTSPTYGSPFDMMKRFGISYRLAGENIARGYRTPQAVVDAWMNSAGHRANILKSGYTQIGVGYVANGNYWTQMFIG